MKKGLILLWLLLLPLSLSACGSGNTDAPVKISLTAVETGEEAVVVMEAGAAVDEFLDQLPLTIEMHDFHEREKFGPMERHLSEDEAVVSAYEVGDFSYGIPFTSIIVFYEQDGEIIDGVIRLGTFESGLEIFSESTDSIEVLIDKMD